MSKTCNKCGLTKEYNEFYTHPRTKDGFSGECKVCKRAYQVAQHHSKAGLVTVMYKDQLKNARKRDMLPPTYTLVQLRKHLLAIPEFHILYSQWVDSGYDKNLAPSLDRNNNYQSYSFDNVKLMTWAENRQNYIDDVKSGKLNKLNKAVKAIDSKGKVVGVYNSIAIAARELGIYNTGISAVVNGRQQTAGGYSWVTLKYKY